MTREIICDGKLHAERVLRGILLILLPRRDKRAKVVQREDSFGPYWVVVIYTPGRPA